ncbi:MAG: hypothetical protein AABX07_05705, partial [Nanoarchaeota archaeon]
LNNAYAKQVGDEIFIFNKKTDEYLWTIPKPVMFEKNNQSNKNFGLHYEFSDLSKDVFTIKKVLDKEGEDWLASSERVYPLVVDADFTGSTADGYVYGKNVTYATARSTATDIDVTDSGTFIGNDLIGANYYVLRTFLKFDTSSIGPSGTITQVNLKLTTTSSDLSDVDFDVRIHKYDWSGTDPITAANKETPYDGALASTYDANWRNTLGISTDTQYTSSNLDTTWVNKTGTTYYALLNSNDVSNSAPTGFQRIGVYSQEHSTAANRPILNVTYTMPAVYPIFSNYWDNNASLMVSGTGRFNVTLASTNGTVLLEINNTNVTARNLTANVYNASYAFTSNGTYTYRWHSWGNGTAKDYNKSSDRYYTVTPDTAPPIVTINQPQNTTYATLPVPFNVTLNEDGNACNYTLSNGEVNYTMQKNGNRDFNATNSSIASGGYVVRYYCWDAQNNLNSTATRGFAINSAPQIIAVYNNSMTSLSTGPNEAPAVTGVIINFTAYDADGIGDLNDSTARINFTKTGEDLRLNLSCAKYQSGGNYANYTCNVTMFWWDGTGVWNITAYIKDNQTNSAVNTTTSFFVGERTAFVMSPASLTWPGIAPGAVNQTSNNDPLLLNNTGNDDIAVNEIGINATNLLGESNPSFALWANNFSVSPFTGASKEECNSSAATMNASVYTNVTGALLPAGNFTINNGTGQEQLYFCLRLIGSELTTQDYSTAGTGAWTIRILLVAIAFGKGFRRRKPKHQKAKKNQIENLTIPTAIFTDKLGCLEAITKYLKENLEMSYHEIAQILNRNDRTIWATYHKALKKQPAPVNLEKTMIMLPVMKLEKVFLVLPVSIFKDRNLTILESIVIYLKKKGLKYNEIAKLLNRDQRNVWTIHSKAEKKTKVEEL